MITRLPSRGTLARAFLFIFSSVMLTLFVWRSVGGVVPLKPRQYEVRALFTNASQLTKNSDVRISGVNVGKVATVRPRGLRTEATLSIDEQYAPLPDDVRAILRQKTLLGETFVVLSPGHRKAPRLQDGGTIRTSQIADTQPLDRVLGMLDRPTRRRMRELLTNTSTMLDGRAGDVNDSLGNLAVGTRQLAAVVQILDHQRGSVRRLVRDTGTVLQTVGDEQAGVRELVRSGNQALSATSSRNRELTATIQVAPSFLRELQLSAGAVEHTATLAAPTLRDFRPVAPLVRPALVALGDASPRVSGLLRDLEAFLPTARRALPASARVVRALSPLATQLGPAAAEVTPVIAYVAAYRKELIATMANVAASTNGKSPATDGRPTAYLRTLIPINSESFVGAERRPAGNRHNAYRAPGGLAPLEKGLTSSSCAHAGNSGSAPPCKLQPPWRFAGGPPRYFQHVAPAKP